MVLLFRPPQRPGKLEKSAFPHFFYISSSNKKFLLKRRYEMVNMDFEEVTELYNVMTKEQELKNFCDLKKIKYREDKKQYYIFTDKKQFSSNSRKGLIEKLYNHFLGIKNITLADGFENWFKWRVETRTNSKTLRENMNEWKSFIANSELAKMRVADITILELETFYYSLTADFSITSKRLTNVNVVLNGIFKRCVSLKIIPHNPILDMDMNPFRKRCKPVNHEKNNYTANERNIILSFLSNIDEMYSLAIQLDFCLSVRIGELLSIKYSDFQDGKLQINRSLRDTYSIDENLNFTLNNITNENRIKGNKDTGFREIPLSERAISIIEKAHELNPNGEFLFMKYDRQLNPKTFNKYLKNYCEKVGVKYRPSHQVRFTVATNLYENGVSINQLSYLLGHSETATTWHYIRKNECSENTCEILRTVLN